MNSTWPVVFLFITISISLAFGGCMTTNAMNSTVPDAVPAPDITIVNTTPVPVPIPTKPNLTVEDISFLKSAIEQESTSIKMIGDAVVMIKNGQHESARLLAESAEKNLKSQYNNLSAQPVSPVLQPVKDEILDAIRDEINGTRKLRNIAVSDSEMMFGASKDYRNAADDYFRLANAHLNNAQSIINTLGK